MYYPSFLFLMHTVCLRHLWDIQPYALLLVFLFIWSYSLVHFKNGSEYLTRWTAQVFIPLIRFRLCSFVLNSFCVLLRYSFNFFFLLHLFDGVHFQYAQIFVSFLFIECSEFFLHSIVLILLSFSASYVCMAHFSMPNSIPISWPYILTAYIRVSNSFSFLANSLMSSVYMRWLIFSCNLKSL